jgi:hypothetical protein
MVTCINFISEAYFVSSIIAKTLTGLHCMYEQHGGCLIRSRNWLPFASSWVHPRFLSRSVAHLFSLLVVLWRVFTLRVPCCDVRCNSRIKTMFGSSLPTVICICLHLVVSNTYCVVFLFCFSSSCVRYVASFCGLSIFDFHFGLL